VNITFEKSGGIGGMVGQKPPKIIDTSSLSSDMKKKVEDIINHLNFYKLKNMPYEGKGADYFEYTITVEEGSQKNTITVNDITLRGQPELKNLVSTLEGLPAKQ
jgi:hypothetical protein